MAGRVHIERSEDGIQACVRPRVAANVLFLAPWAVLTVLWLAGRFGLVPRADWLHSGPGAAGLVAYGLFLLYRLAMRVVGMESITVRPDQIRITRGLLGIEFVSREFFPQECRHLRYRLYAADDLSPWRRYLNPFSHLVRGGGEVLFEHDEGIVRLGRGLKRAEGLALVRALKPYFD